MAMARRTMNATILHGEEVTDGDGEEIHYPQTVRWLPPPIGSVIKISCDGSYLANSDTGISIVCGDYQRRFVSEVKINEASSQRRRSLRNELHEDVLYEIFSWLPAKSIFKFKLCSKSIFEVTNKTDFALKQSQNLMLKDDYSFFIQGRISSQNNIVIFKTEIHALPGNETSSGVHSNFLRFVNLRSVQILASTNGLLLCLVRQSTYPRIKLSICNPVTQSCSTIATPPSLQQNPYAKVIFAFECNHNKGVHDDQDYQLILFERGVGEQNFVCKVYMSREGVWKNRKKRLFMVGGSMIYDSPVLYKGTIYFATRWEFTTGRNYHYMSSYNVESGETRTVGFPEEVATIGYEFSSLDHVNIGIFKWGKAGSSNESLCLVSLVKGYIFTVWVLNDCESSCWSKFLTLSLEEMRLDDYSIASKFTIMNGDSLVFSTQTRSVYKYNLIGAREGRLEKIGEHGVYIRGIRFIPYSNTLRSCT